jgi:ABC-type sugar transport system ATPase subunit
VLRWDASEIVISSPADALKLGIAVVHQELALMSHRTAAENIYITSLPTVAGTIGRALGLLDRRALYRRAHEFLRVLDFPIDPDAVVGSLNQAQRQLVEIARALAQDARLLILDEPTSALPPNERRDLAVRVRGLRDRGIAIVLVTHLLTEAHELADRVTVLRDGRNVGTRRPAEVAIQQLISMMTGKLAEEIFATRSVRLDESQTPCLEVRGVESLPSVKSVSFAVYPREIVGLAGLMGSGRTETLETIFGVRRASSGEIRVNGERLVAHSPHKAIEKGLAFIPEDRQEEGLLPEQSVRVNIAIAASQARRGESVMWGNSPVVSMARLRQVAQRFIGELDIRVTDPALPVRTLSGGNQQKVILARWLAMRPTLILADEPTRGVSIGSKAEIYRLLRTLADGGAGVVLVSSEFEELIGLCNRIIIMRKGETIADIDCQARKDLDADALLHLVLSAESGSMPMAGKAGATE